MNNISHISSASKPGRAVKKYALTVGTMVLLGVYCIVANLPVQAVEIADATSSAQQNIGSASPSASTTTQLKKRLERILGDQDSSISAEKRIGGYLGEITRVSEEALAVKTPNGSQIIPLDETIAILRNNRPLPVADISVGNWIIAIGNRVKNGDVSPTTIIVQTASPKAREHIVSMGTVDAVGRSTIEFIPRGQTDPITLTVARDSKLVDSANEPITIRELPTQVSAIAVAFMDTSTNTWIISTLKTMVEMDEFKDSTPEPTPVPTRRPTPTATAAPTTPIEPAPTPTE